MIDFLIALSALCLRFHLYTTCTTTTTPGQSRVGGSYCVETERECLALHHRKYLYPYYTIQYNIDICIVLQY